MEKWNGIEKAKIYSRDKSSADVFREQHETDYMAGYNQALKDTKADELLEQRNDLLEALRELLIHALEHDLHSVFTENAIKAISKTESKT